MAQALTIGKSQPPVPWDGTAPPDDSMKRPALAGWAIIVLFFAGMSLSLGLGPFANVKVALVTK